MATTNLTINHGTQGAETYFGFLDGTPMMDILEKIKDGDIAGAKEIMSTMESAKVEVCELIATCAGGLAADIELTAESLGKSFEVLTNMVLHLGGGQSALIERFAGEILEAVRAVDEGNKSYAESLAGDLERQTKDIEVMINNAVDNINGHTDMIAGGMTAHIERQAQGIIDVSNNNTRDIIDAVEGGPTVAGVIMLVITVVLSVIVFIGVRAGFNAKFTREAEQYRDAYTAGTIGPDDEMSMFVDYEPSFNDKGSFAGSTLHIETGKINAMSIAYASVAAVVTFAFGIVIVNMLSSRRRDE